MTCPDRNTLMAWCDKEIASPEADTISEHIKHCESCRDFIIAQKQMESVWRDAWTDPGEARFKKMRSSIKNATPWWRTQRTWFIAAALCAAYIGVKVFYIDGTGTPLSGIALEETSVPAASGDVSAVQEETAVEEMEETVTLEFAEEEVGNPPVELASGQSETSEVIEELSVSDSGASEGDMATETTGDADLVYDHPEVVFSAAEEQYPVDSEDITDLPGTVDESVEQEAVYRTVSSISSEPAGSSGMVEGTLSGGAGGGGETASGSAGMLPAPVSEDQCDDLVEDIHSDLPAQSESSVITYSVFVTLESKEVIQIQRFQWNSLFSMIDALQEGNWNPSVEMLVFTVSSEGIISGDNVDDGAVIAVPEAGYGTCVVTVHFF